MVFSKILIFIVGVSLFLELVVGFGTSSNEGVSALADGCKCNPTVEDTQEGITRCVCHSSSITYFKSTNDGNLNEAVGECRTRHSGMLTCIEKKGELDEIQEVLDGEGKVDPGTRYWVNAAIDSDSGKWVWLCSKPFKPQLFHGFPWASGHPFVPADPKVAYGIQLIYGGPGTDIKFEIVSYSDSGRYLCEL